MPVLLGLLVFSVLLTPGNSLQCETCTAVSTSCSGPILTCGATEDACAVTFNEGRMLSGQHVTQTIAKGCSSTKVCVQGPYYINLGKMFTSRGTIACCSSTDCASVSVPLPPINNTLNGKKCPACYSLLSPCSTDTVECTGAEDQCLDLNIKSGSMEIIMKGCTTKNYCNSLSQNLKNTFKEFRVETVDGKCRPADNAAPSSRVPLLALPLLLLVKILL